MKIACFADLHARGKDLAAFSKQWSTALELAELSGCDRLLIAGDVYDKPNIADSKAGTGAIEAAVLGPLVKFGMPTIAIAGNHDIRGGDSVSALASMAALPFVTLVDEVPAWEFFGGLAVLCMPYQWNPAPHGSAGAALRYFVNLRPPCERKVLLFHAPVIGAKTNAGHVYDSAKPGTWYFTREDMDFAALHFDRIVGGDFHGRQDLTGGKGGFVGALRQADFGEEGNPQGFEIWDTASGQVEWVSVDAAPRYRTVRLAEGQPVPCHAQANEYLRIIADGYIPDGAQIQAAEKNGVRVDISLDRVERVARVSVPDGAIHHSPDLLRLWASTQNPPFATDEMNALVDELAALEGDAAVRKEGKQ